MLAADSNPGTVRCSPGGVARNVAENLARLGHRTALISAVGDDLFGQSLRQATRDAGVNVQALAVVPGQRTASYVSMQGHDGDMVLAVNDMAILESLTPHTLSTYTQQLETAACLVLDCNLAQDALHYLMADVAAAHDVPVFVDGVSVAKCQRLLASLTRVHTLKLNRLEVQMLSGAQVETVEQACSAARQLHQRGVREVVVSLGVQGVCWCDAAGNTGHRPARSVPVVSTSGAGDALLAGLVHGFLRRMPLADAVAFAMACAEMTLSSACANHPDLSLSAVSSLIPR